MTYEPSWIDLETVHSIHARQLVKHGGLAGVRDLGLIENAIARPRQLFAYEHPEPTLERLAAAYGHSISASQGYADGNKRTGAVVAITFLRANQRDVTASSREVFEMFKGLADGSLDEGAAIAWFEQRCTRVQVWQST